MSTTRESVGTNTAALFAGTSFYSRRVLVPLNPCAFNEDLYLSQLYCVHSISGNAGTDFLELAGSLEQRVRVYGVQAPPAFMNAIEFGNSIETLAEYYADSLIAFQPKGVFYIAGYCVGAVIALAMANYLRTRGREVELLVVIDGVPENTPFALARWNLRFWTDVAHNAFLRARHFKTLRGRSLNSVAISVRHNLAAVTKNILGMSRAQKFGGGYSPESFLDLSRYSPAQVSFINRLFGAIFEHQASQYSGRVVVYEATIRPFLFLPQIGRIWRKLAVRTELVQIHGTHDQILRRPHVNVLADDLLGRIVLHAKQSQACSPPTY